MAFTNPSDAWDYLVEAGGVEPKERDQLFVEQLRQRLDAKAPDLATALSGATIERFLNAFFGLLTPFVSMMRDLLLYFENASATEGPNSWTFVLGGSGDTLEVNLDHFKTWLDVFSRNVSPRKVLGLSAPLMWEVWRAFDKLHGNSREYRLGTIPAAADPDCREWLRNYEQHGWMPLPLIVERNSARDDAIGEYAGFIIELAAELSTVFPNYRALYANLWSIREELPPEIAAYASNEHDRWIQSSVLNLLAFERASRKDRQLVEATLSDVFRGLPHNQSRFQFSNKTLAEVLSLPLWKKRYELYAAWIFTQILQSLHGHHIDLHHDNGKLKFAFRETPLATVNSLRKPITVFSEKRIPAQNLQGHGRVASIQPDYSAWWKNECPLAIECKHYKKSSTNFADALFDYSRNLQQATVLLVNYGPIGAHLKAMTDRGGDGGRRFAWGNLNPDFPAQVDAFRNAVRRAVGEPLSHNTVLMIDVSTSMAEPLRSGHVQEYIAELIRRVNPSELVAVDEVIRGAFEPTHDGVQQVAQLSGGGTSLLDPAGELQREYGKVYVLTDQDGIRSLGSAAKVLEQRALAPIEIIFASVESEFEGH